MPIITAYSGEVSVRGNSQGELEKFYENSKTAYGATIGELLDNLVIASIALANETFEWITVNRNADYSMKDDYWYTSSLHPDILLCQVKNPSDDAIDVQSGGSINSIEGIVKKCVMHRHVAISSAASSLRFALPGESMIPEEPKVDHSDIYQAVSMSELPGYGFTGAELSSILMIGVGEGRVAEYVESRNRIASLHAMKVAANAPRPSRWWRW